jgi:hypothetical protein
VIETRPDVAASLNLNINININAWVPWEIRMSTSWDFAMAIIWGFDLLMESSRVAIPGALARQFRKACGHPVVVRTVAW